METRYEDAEVRMKPLKMPPHLTLSGTAEAARGLGSRWDSTRRSVQSPNPVEIRSKKSPEKLRLPQPTDLDLDTLRPKEEEDDDALGLSLSPVDSARLGRSDPKTSEPGFSLGWWLTFRAAEVGIEWYRNDQNPPPDFLG